jgi:fumarate hydratase class II
MGFERLCMAIQGKTSTYDTDVFKPLMVHNVLESAELLADACRAFEEHCARGIEPDTARIAEHLDACLMLVTALNPHIGYEKSAKIALKAHREGLTLREAALALGFVTPEQFDAWVRPDQMTHPLPD